jgi:Rrf2 family protein
MQLSMKCSVAVHCLIFINEAKGKAKVTSSLLAQSTGCNPVVIRNVFSALKKAGMITVARGTGGAELCMPPSEITLYQIYQAIEPNGLSSLIGIHPCDGRACPVAQNIRAVLTKPYQKIEDAIRKTMEETTLESMIEDFHNRTSNSASPVHTEAGETQQA